MEKSFKYVARVSPALTCLLVLSTRCRNYSRVSVSSHSLNKMFGKSALILSGFGLLASALPGPGHHGPHHGAAPGGYGDIKIQDPSKLITDPLLTYGPEIEVVHYYYDEWPTGIAVSKEGRLFSNYPGGLDPANVNNGRNGVYTVAELNPDNTGEI